MQNFHPFDDDDSGAPEANRPADSDTRMGVILLGVAALALGVYSVFQYMA